MPNLLQSSLLQLPPEDDELPRATPSCMYNETLDSKCYSMLQTGENYLAVCVGAYSPTVLHTSMSGIVERIS